MSPPQESAWPSLNNGTMYALRSLFFSRFLSLESTFFPDAPSFSFRFLSTQNPKSRLHSHCQKVVGRQKSWPPEEPVTTTSWVTENCRSRAKRCSFSALISDPFYRLRQNKLIVARLSQIKNTAVARGRSQEGFAQRRKIQKVRFRLHKGDSLVFVQWRGAVRGHLSSVCRNYSSHWDPATRASACRLLASAAAYDRSNLSEVVTLAVVAHIYDFSPTLLISLNRKQTNSNPVIKPGKPDKLFPNSTDIYGGGCFS